MEGIVQTSKGPVVDLRWLLDVVSGWLWLALPAVLIALGIRAWRRPPGGRREELVLLLLAAASCAWLLLAFPFPAVLGPAYDTPRYAILLANLAGMIVLAPWAAFRTRALRRYVVPAAVVLAGHWLLVLIASSVL